MTRIIIDTDPGIDDAVALAAALFDPELDIRLLTTVAGNVNADKTTNNLLRLLTFWGKQLPVAKGAVRPLMRELNDAADVHGQTGMDGFPSTKVDCPLLPVHAVEAMRSVLLDETEPTTLVALGPLTNVALLFATYPEVKQKISRLVLMGGSTLRGNKTPMAEFNIAADPEAAKIVFSAGVPMVVCGLNIGPQATLPYEACLKMRELNDTGRMLYDLLEKYKSGNLKDGRPMYDSTAIGFLVRPEMYQTTSCYADVETQSPLTFGCTVFDVDGLTGLPANAAVCTGLDKDEFLLWLLEAIGRAVIAG